MAEFTANDSQLVQINRNVLFTETPIPGNASILHREGSGIVTLRGLVRCNCQTRARFKVTYSANIAVPSGTTPTAIGLAIAQSGESLASSMAIATPTVAESYFNVSGFAFIDVPAGCCTQISLQNISTVPIRVANANFGIDRIA